MRVAMVCPRGVPPVRGGAERLWDGIVREINALTPHDAEIVAVDAPETNFHDVLNSYARFDDVDLTQFDLVISGKYPAWMVRHPRHVVYMAHPIRGLYDTYTGPLEVDAGALAPVTRALFDTVRSSVPGRPGARQRVLDAARAVTADVPVGHPDVAYPGPLARAVVHWLDRDALHPANTVRHLAISHTVAGRKDYFPDPAAVDVIIPPSGLDGIHGGDGRYLFTASRLDGPKRVGLLIDAMAFVDDDVELRIAGTGPLREELRRRALGDDRITFLDFVGDDQLVAEYAGAIAVPFVPMDEDLGLITLEAQMSGKPVVTCTDSGGATELVDDGVDGFVVEPTPFHVGQALRRLVGDRALADDMGRRGAERARRVTWGTLVDGLLRPAPPRPTLIRRRPHVVALSTYPAVPARHGGQVRLQRLLTALAADADVHLLAIGHGDTGPTSVVPGFVQTTVRPGADFDALDLRLTGATGVPCTDIAATLAHGELGSLGRLFHDASADADAVLLAHPYLMPLVTSLVESGHPATVIYDAHNAEHELKRTLYAPNPPGAALADAVREVEAAAVRAAMLVTSVAKSDIDALRRLAPTMADYVLVPNGGDVADTPFVGGVHRRRRRTEFLHSLREAGVPPEIDSVALFLGSGHPPNVAGALELLAIAPTMPNTLFVLVGSHVDVLGGVPAGDNVLARGPVGTSELGYLLSCCDVALNPMATGSGTNIKMLDYFAVGAPVVSTLTGARGLGAEPGVHYLAAESDEFAAAIAASLADEPAADERARAGRVLAEPFDWTVLGSQFAAAVHSVLAEAAAPTTDTTTDTATDMTGGWLNGVPGRRSGALHPESAAVTFRPRS